MAGNVYIVMRHPKSRYTAGFESEGLVYGVYTERPRALAIAAHLNDKARRYYEARVHAKRLTVGSPLPPKANEKD
jgi:hypothetical protein